MHRSSHVVNRVQFTSVKLARTFVNTPKLAIASSQNGRFPRELGDTFAHVTDASIQNKSTLVVNSWRSLPETSFLKKKNFGGVFAKPQEMFL